uniref:Uncharacterized protein n=1 Tax=viral metagenome TaxID=1070528 RepID=A0A6C0EFR1_9ZZZZ
MTEIGLAERFKSLYIEYFNKKYGFISIDDNLVIIELGKEKILVKIIVFPEMTETLTKSMLEPPENNPMFSVGNVLSDDIITESNDKYSYHHNIWNAFTEVILYCIRKKYPYTGKLYKYNKSGKLILDSTYVEGKKEGYYYKKTKYKGPFLSRDPCYSKIKKCYYKNGILHGEMSRRNVDDKLYYHESIDYIDGVINGKHKQYNRNGKVEYECDYVNDKKHGNEFAYYYNKKKNKTIITLEVNYVMDLPNGTIIKRHKNGVTKLRGVYVNGLKDGIWTEWHDNHEKKSEREYSNGKKIGKLFQWYKNKLPKLEVTFKDGHALRDYIQWTKDGKRKELTFTRSKHV